VHGERMMRGIVSLVAAKWLSSDGPPTKKKMMKPSLIPRLT